MRPGSVGVSITLLTLLTWLAACADRKGTINAADTSGVAPSTTDTTGVSDPVPIRPQPKKADSAKAAQQKDSS
jgi:hypothetical protein